MNSSSLYSLLESLGAEMPEAVVSANDRTVYEKEDILSLLITEGLFFDLESCEEEEGMAAARSFIRSLGPSRLRAGDIIDSHFRHGIETSLRLPGEPCLLNNPESLCYMTSVLEMLSLVKPFVKTIAAMSSEEGPLLNALATILALKENGLRKNIDIDRLFEAFQGELASEYISKEVSKDASSFLADLTMMFRKYDRKDLMESFSGNIKNSFGKTELFVSLPLSIGSGSLESALEDFFNGQKLSNEGVALTYRIGAIPQYLICQLKRFKIDRESCSYHKDNSPFDYEEEVDFSPYIAADRPQASTHYNYRLIGVIVHEGSVAEGHYFNFTRYRSMNGSATWYYINDGVKRECTDFSEVRRRTCGGTAYMFLYEREGRLTALDGGDDTVVLGEYLSAIVEQANEEICLEAILGGSKT